MQEMYSLVRASRREDGKDKEKEDGKGALLECRVNSLQFEFIVLCQVGVCRIIECRIGFAANRVP